MPNLRSKAFTDATSISTVARQRLQRCADSGSQRIFSGAADPTGEHVGAIHKALNELFGGLASWSGIAKSEIDTQTYGPTTTTAIKIFKINGGLNGTGGKILFPGQPEVDGIVGQRTIAALDDKLFAAQPTPLPPKPTLAKRSFEFIVPTLPLTLKHAEDPFPAEDLENAPVNRSLMTALVKSCFVMGVPIPSVEAALKPPPTVAQCELALRSRIGEGGPTAADMADHFFKNSIAPSRSAARILSSGSDLAKAIERDGAFVARHDAIKQAIDLSLRQLASSTTAAKVSISVGALADSATSPGNELRVHSETAGIDFSFQHDFSRLVRKDVLAFALGSLQGVTLRLTEFSGNSDGTYKGSLEYEYADHFGSNDSDVIERGQAALWLLQRKMAKDSATAGTGYEPYRVQITVPKQSFSGALGE